MQTVAKHLLIVESPAKAKTIERYLGKDYQVKSSYGHIRDLEKDDMGIDIKNNFKPSFNQNVEFSEREREVLKLICEEKTAAEIAKEIFLSPRSVEGIRQRLIEKVGVRNTAGLVMFAIKNGIVT